VPEADFLLNFEMKGFLQNRIKLADAVDDLRISFRNIFWLNFHFCVLDELLKRVI